jgi:3-dehydroquinate synthase
VEQENLTVHVDLGTRSYDIEICSDSLSRSAQNIDAWMNAKFGPASGRKSAIVVTDKNVVAHAAVVQDSLNSAAWKTSCITLEPGEPTKTLSVIDGLYDRMVEAKADRKTVVVAVGGGVIGDAAGFLASTYGRGVPFVQVPTTLLAQVDSSVGGKVGINHSAAKNLIGSFYQPLGVCIDTSVLKTLPDRDYRAGMAEVVKYGVILDAEFFDYQAAHVSEINRRDPATLRYLVAQCCRLKAGVVEQDEYERTGVRAVLNYGHTFAHAFEALCGYGELMHGEAVSIGMLYASRLAELRGLIDSDMTARQLNLLRDLHMPTELPNPSDISADDIIEKMYLDKKTVGGQLRFILPTKMGHVTTFADITESQVRQVIAEFQ